MAEGIKNRDPSPLRVLGDVRFLGALGVLLFNDLYLKPVHPGFVSGKLSDVAGFVVFPVIVAVVGGLVVRQWASARRGAPVAIVGFIAAWFVGLQVSAPIDGLHEAVMGTVLPWSPINTPDLTDLVALPAAFVGWRVLDDARSRTSVTLKVGHKTRAAVLGVGLLACVADQPPPQPEFGAIVEQPDGSLEVRLGDNEWDFARLESTDRGVTWERVETGEELDNTSALAPAGSPEACLNSDPGRCVRVEKANETDVRIVETFNGEEEEVWRHIDERYARQSWGSPFGPGAVTVLDDDIVLVTTRGGPIVRRDADGSWTPDPLSLRRGDALIYVFLIGFVIVATLLALMLRGHRMLKVGLIAAAGALTLFLPAPQHVDLGIIGFVWLLGLVVFGGAWIVLMTVVIARGVSAEVRSKRLNVSGPSTKLRVLLAAMPLLIVAPAIPWLIDVDIRLSAVWYGNWMLLIVGGGALIWLSPTEANLRPPPATPPTMPSVPVG